MAKLKSYQMLINGDWVDAEGGNTFISRNPATGEAWAEIPEASEADVDAAVRAAHGAFTDSAWANCTPSQRGQYLRNLADLLRENGEALGRTESLDSGKIFTETRWQANYIAEFFQYYAGCADKLHGETLPIDKPDMFAFTRREPLGVVAAVVPWNSQLFLVAVKLGPALAAGNTVVLKTSEHASAALLEFGELVAQAGFPPGVVNIVTGHGEPCGRALTSHPLVARVSFTGGTDAARQVVRNSAENFAEVSLELGGKSPFIVFDDADLESAVNGCIAGIFAASGQSCVAGSRLYLHEKIADAFVEKMLIQAKAIRIGGPLDEATQVGPLCTEAQLARVETEIATAKKQGAKVLCGGRRPPGLGDGWYFEPTIIECPKHDMPIVDSELFAPVLCVLRFRDEAEVITYANATRHGLAAGVFTKDGARGLRVAQGIRAGILWLNTYRVISPIAAFGGFKDSGYGRESGFQAMYDYTRSKTVWMNLSDAPVANPFGLR